MRVIERAQAETAVGDEPMIPAEGGVYLVRIGSSGTVKLRHGQSMLARRLPTILPPLTVGEPGDGADLQRRWPAVARLGAAGPPAIPARCTKSSAMPAWSGVAACPRRRGQLCRQQKGAFCSNS